MEYRFSEGLRELLLPLGILAVAGVVTGAAWFVHEVRIQAAHPDLPMLILAAFSGHDAEVWAQIREARQALRESSLDAARAAREAAEEVRASERESREAARAASRERQRSVREAQEAARAAQEKARKAMRNGLYPILFRLRGMNPANPARSDAPRASVPPVTWRGRCTDCRQGAFPC
ncbi:MAG: hypothetical protein U5J83_17665 [Bryobacterales bacterium]|nr:hypothetical protein [Bryobacterales bacterium]